MSSSAPSPKAPRVSTATGTKQKVGVRLAYVACFFSSASRATTPGPLSANIALYYPLVANDVEGELDFSLSKTVDGVMSN
jgi:hypothetical protein